MSKAKLKPLSEQVIVITGASSGIGLATALLAAERGARLVLAARSQETCLEIVAQIHGRGGQALFVPCDVTERAQVENVVRAALGCFGRVDTWVNNAGVSIYGRLDEVSEEHSRQLFETNFWGVYHGSMAILPHLKQYGGALINLGSEVSETVAPLQGMYSASKHAVKGFTDALRIEIEEMDQAPVAITLIQPTATNTPFPQHAKNYLAKEPKLPGPLHDPKDVAEAILATAIKPTRHVRVGIRTKIHTATVHLVPSLADKLAAKQAGQQQLPISPLHPEGTLDRPGEAVGEAGQVHGLAGARS